MDVPEMENSNLKLCVNVEHLCALYNNVLCSGELY